MAETGDDPSFRTVKLDNDEDYPAHVRPIADGVGFVTVVWRNNRSGRLFVVHRNTVAMLVGRIGVAGVASWIVAGLALTPARRSMRDQQAFLADAAHEMRTPLAVIFASSSQALSRANQ